MYAETWTLPRGLVIGLALAAGAAVLPDRPAADEDGIDRWLFVRNRAAQPIAIDGVALFEAPVLVEPRVLLPGQCMAVHLIGPAPAFEMRGTSWRVHWTHGGTPRWVRMANELILDIAGSYATGPATRTCVPCGPGAEVEVSWDPRRAVAAAPDRWDAGDYRSGRGRGFE